MTETNSTFDAYHVWLGIPPKDQPPHYYRLLGIDLFEENADVIDAAANRQSTYLHSMSSGPHRQECQQLLNEIATARLCLLNKEAKRKYDQQLKEKLTPQGRQRSTPLIVVDEEQKVTTSKSHGTKTRAGKQPTKPQTTPIWKVYGLAALLIAALVAGGIYLFSDSEQTSPNASTETPTDEPTQTPFRLGE